MLDSNSKERFRRTSSTREIGNNGMLMKTSSVENSSPENHPKFRQYKPTTSNAGEESCDSGDYFFSLSKDMKTMKTIPVSEL